jgi:hypothetical protein
MISTLRARSGNVVDQLAPLVATRIGRAIRREQDAEDEDVRHEEKRDKHGRNEVRGPLLDVARSP